MTTEFLHLCKGWVRFIPIALPGFALPDYHIGVQVQEHKIMCIMSAAFQSGTRSVVSVGAVIF